MRICGAGARADNAISWLTQSQPSRFQGQQEDAETGLHYNRYRYYDAPSRRYISRDPIGLTGGLNAYSYASAPNAQVDPLGLSPTWCNKTQRWRES